MLNSLQIKLRSMVPSCHHAFLETIMPISFSRGASTPGLIPGLILPLLSAWWHYHNQLFQKKGAALIKLLLMSMIGRTTSFMSSCVGLMYSIMWMFGFSLVSFTSQARHVPCKWLGDALPDSNHQTDGVLQTTNSTCIVWHTQMTMCNYTTTQAPTHQQTTLENSIATNKQLATDDL